jgi:g-D-glutamyl-meso-diaminopimelate peptidase
MKRILSTISFIVLLLILLPSYSYAETTLITGELLQEEVPYYIEGNLETPVGSLKGMNSLYQFSVTPQAEWMSVQIGGKKFVIATSMVQIVDQTLPPLTSSHMRLVETLSTFNIYSGANVASKVIVSGQLKQSLQTISYDNGFFVVNVGGEKGFIKSSDVVVGFAKPEMFIEVLKDVPLYEVKSRQRSQFGALKKGMVFKRTKQVANWHQIEMNGRVYQVEVSHTFPSPKEVTLKPIPKTVYPAAVITDVNAPVINGAGQHIGTLKVGQTVRLANIRNNLGYIDFMGSLAYVQLKNVKHTNLVQPKKNISASEMSYWLQMYAGMYPEFTKLEVIGKSVEGRPIYALRVGNGKKEILMDGSLHAREHMTTNLLLEMIDSYSLHYLKKSTVGGFNVRQVLDQTSIWFVPMVNPDGVTLVQGGKNAVKNGALATRINGSTNFARWKANVRGVDLNDNFDSGWSLINSAIKKPNYMGYRGPRVFSEPEAVALKNFVEKHHFKSYISYHTAGQVLYWFMFQQQAQLARDIQYVNQLSAITGYSVMSPLYKRGSGASTDWFIQKTKNPAVTVEIGPYTGEKPVPHVYFDRVWKQNYKVGLHAANEAAKR